MEVVDLIVINKDDGDNYINVVIVWYMYESVLYILWCKYDEWQLWVLICSVLEKCGIDEIWYVIIDFKIVLIVSGCL